MIDSRKELALSHILLVGGSMVALFPLVAVLLQALAAPGIRVSGFEIPAQISLAHFAEAWTEGAFGRALQSSAIVALSVVAGAVSCAVLGGYALANLRVPLERVVLATLLIGLVMPIEARIIPLYRIAEQWGILDTYWALILPQIASGVPLGIFWMRIFFRSVPPEIREAATLDGAAPRHILWHVLLPLAWPAITTLSCLLFLWTWNEFLLALVLTPQNELVQTAPLSLSYFAGNTRVSQPSVVAAAAVLVAAPVVIAYAFLQRRFIKGLFSGV